MVDRVEPIENFNLETMSGVFPGTRTMVFQRVRIVPLETGRPTEWYQVEWHTDPPGAHLYPRTRNAASRPHVSLAGAPHTIHARLQDLLTARGLRLDACGVCSYWRPVSATTQDDLALGQCTWREDDGRLPPPDALGLQSALALACRHLAGTPGNGWTKGTPPLPAPASEAPPGEPHLAQSAAATPGSIADPDLPSATRSLWRRFISFLRAPRSAVSQAEKPLERSGVGAGTEPCFCCQGRLANLGALVVESQEGDKQTLSIWRCRLCAATFLNDWIDRWERLDSLETEERYYRLAPAEATRILELIHSEAGGDHPAQRAHRSHLRAAVLGIVAGAEALSHQVRQGR
jgi:hypothetical protein